MGNVPPPGSPVPIITWECSTNGGPFSPVPYTDFSPTKFCFNVPKDVVTTNCTSPSQGFEDKTFRATLVVTDPTTGTICTSMSSLYNLRICCPVTTPTVVLQVQPPSALNGTLCEGDVVMVDVSLTGLPAWFPPTAGSVVTLDWFLNNDPIVLAPGTTQFPHPVTVGVSDLCFSVKIKNCACPEVTAETCIQVDPEPKCGSIIGCHANLTLLSSTPMLCYEICPYNAAELCIDLPFSDCDWHWEFSFDNATWQNLGGSNDHQLTNTLPCNDIGSPYEWPMGQQCIYYRVVGLPYSNPSGCDPCYSNSIKVCLKPSPVQPNVVISGSDHICDGSAALLSVTNPEAVTYTWYCNGVVVQVGSSSTYSASQQAWYWVEADNGCEIIESNHVFLTVCKVTAVISCPLFPNPCAKLNEEIHLSGCDSKSTCGGPLTYSWTASNGQSGTTSSAIDLCDFYHFPDPNGTTYTLTVTDPFGCSDTATSTVIPCQN